VGEINSRRAARDRPLSARFQPLFNPLDAFLQVHEFAALEEVADKIVGRQTFVVGEFSQIPFGCIKWEFICTLHQDVKQPAISLLLTFLTVLLATLSVLWLLRARLSNDNGPFVWVLGVVASIQIFMLPALNYRWKEMGNKFPNKLLIDEIVEIVLFLKV
jgi:hypothetical protein